MVGLVTLRILLISAVAAILLLSCLVPISESRDAEMSREYGFDLYFERPTLNSSSGLIALGSLPDVSRSGMPALPCQSVKILIPDGWDLVGVRLEGGSLQAAGRLDRPLPMSGTAPLSDDRYLSWTAPAPLRSLPEGAEHMGTFQWHGEQVAVINIYPLSVDLINGDIAYLPRTELRLSLRASEDMEDIDTPQDPLIVDTLQPAEGLSIFEYVIITSQELQPAFHELVDWKAGRGASSAQLRNLTSTVVSLEWIASQPEFWGDEPQAHGGTGNDTQTQTREFISWAYANWGTRYVLLGGDDEVLPARQVRVYAELAGSIPADIYYSGLDGDWDTDGDGIYGEAAGAGGGSEGEEADLLPEVQVGRATVDSSNEVDNFVNKVMAYEADRSCDYLNEVLLVGERLDTVPTWGGDYKDEVRALAFPETEPMLNVDTLYERDGTFSGGAFVSAVNSGVHIVNHMGHGDWDEFAELTIEDIDRLTNTEFFIMFSQACLIGAFDQETSGGTDSIAEHLISSSSGAVAVLVNSRFGWYSPGSTDGSSQQYDIEFFDALFGERIRSLGSALSDAKTDLLPQVLSTGTMRWCYMTLNLLGDPETEVHFLEDRYHDMAVHDVMVGDAYDGVSCQVDARVINLGVSDETDVPVELLVNGQHLSTQLIDIHSNESYLVHFEWVPDVPGVAEVMVRCNLSTDSWHSNDVVTEAAVVDWLITGTDILEGEHLIIDVGILVDASGCLILSNSTLTFDPGDDGPLKLEVLGCLRVENSTLNSTGSPGCLMLTAPGSELGLHSSIIGNIGERDALMEMEIHGSLSMEESDLWSLGGILIREAPSCQIDRTRIFTSSALTIEDCLLGEVDDLYLEGEEDGVVLDGCGSFSLSGEIRAGHTGLSMIDCTDCWVTDTLISDGAEGLRLSRCTSVHILNSTIINNTHDFGLFGSVPDHFHHQMVGSTVSAGEIVYIDHRDHIEVGPDQGAGVLVLASCQEVSVSGLDLANNLQGLLIVNCTSVTVTGCNLSDNAVGLSVMLSQGVIVNGNDFLGNGVHVEAMAVILNGSYQIGGNYWDNYTGADALSGPAQDQPQGDGIGDTPHTICHGGIDRYPLMRRANAENQPPMASFILSEDQLITGQTLLIEDLSSDTDGIIVNWTWDMGDGIRIHSQRAEHAYAQDGIYTVTLWVMDDCRQWGHFSEQVTVSNRPPEVDFDYSPEFPQVGQEVSFTDHSCDPDGEIVYWNWSFGDGVFSHERNPSHAFDVGGEQIVILLVIDDDGESSQLSRGVTVGNELPLAGFSFSPSTPFTGETVQFTDHSVDPGGTLVSWYWLFGDGSGSYDRNPVHVYDDDGHYTVSLEVEDDSGAKSGISASLEVLNRPPVAIILFSPSDPLSGESVGFQDGSVDPDGAVVGWLWDFGDGLTSSLQSPIHSFSAGNHTVSLTVRDDDGGSANSSIIIEVRNRAPVAGFSLYPDSVSSLEQVRCTDLSQDLDGEIVSWNWSFGDGSFSDLKDPSHVYLRSGEYTVTLVVIDDMGAADIHVATIMVMNLAPVSGFTWERDAADQTVMIFTSAAYDPDGVNLSYLWNFGDENCSTQPDPVHDFASEGVFTVSLTVTDDEGASSSFNDSLEVLLPDLTVGDIILPLNVSHGKMFQLDVAIVNQGLVRVENVTVCLVLDGLDTGSGLLSLEGGSSDSLSFQLTLLEGNHTLQIVVDRDGLIEESCEENNSVPLLIQVGPPERVLQFHWESILILMVLIAIPLLILIAVVRR